MDMNNNTDTNFTTIMDGDNNNNSTNTTTMTMTTTPVIVSWTPIYVTLLISTIQGIVFYIFFLYQRNKYSTLYHIETNKLLSGNETNEEEVGAVVVDSNNKGEREGMNTALIHCQLYEPRQYNRSHRSPPPFGDTSNNNSKTKTKKQVSWWRACLSITNHDLLHCVGLDTYMFLRLLYIGTRITGFGTILSFILLPIYATGNNTNIVQFNLFTIARVEQGTSWRLYCTVIVWYIYCSFILYEFWYEWKMYYKHRTTFDATGDIDMPIEYRYTVRVEQIRTKNNTDQQLYQYFTQFFPNKIHSTVSVLQTTKLEALVIQRQKIIEKLEGIIASNMYIMKKKPNTTIQPKLIQVNGIMSKKVDAISYYETEIQRLNNEIDTLRSTILSSTGAIMPTTTTTSSSTTASKVDDNDDDVYNHHDTTTASFLKKGDSTTEEGFETGLDMKLSSSLQQPTRTATTTTTTVVPATTTTTTTPIDTTLTTTTAFVTFTSLRAKQAAIQCELTGDPDMISVYPAADPKVGTIWNNVTVPLQRQLLLQSIAACFFTVGILFWAFPVAFVTSISNLNSILEAFNLKQANPNAFWYGLVAGLLPVIMLAVLMIVLYMIINAAAMKFIRYKSYPEVDAYCLYWHMLFQFANLWLLIIGGSLFNQIDTIIKEFEINAFVETIALAMPGASVFFVNMIICSSFNAFGMELSMLVPYIVNKVMNIISPIDSRTQRQLNATVTTAPSIVWGQKIPPIIFIFMVSIIYMPIVPIMSIFAFVYFLGSYIVMKHQCLHVYAQEVEGGGSATWQQVFGFLMSCLYIGELIFIAYMGIKTAPVQSGLGFVPLIVTGIFHRLLYRKYIEPIQTLSLQVAADVDIRDGELSNTNSTSTIPLYRQPVLNMDQDERGPMPYRSNGSSTTTNTQQGAV